MKFLILLALVAVATAATVRFNSADSHRFNVAFKQALHARLGMGTHGDVIPPFNETHALNDTHLPFDEDLIRGFVNLTKAVAHGLHKLEDDIDFNLITLKVIGNIKVADVQLIGEYATQLVLHLPFVKPPFGEETTSSGAGKGDVGASGVEIGFNAKIHPNFITDRVTISNLDASLVISALRLNLENLIVDDLPVDWDAVNGEALDWLNELIAEEKPALDKTIEGLVNKILADISLQDILDLIG